MDQEVTLKIKLKNILFVCFKGSRVPPLPDESNPYLQRLAVDIIEQKFAANSKFEPGTFQLPSLHGAPVPWSHMIHF